MPVENSVALVALVGTIAASLLEYITGFAMESLFHVRYWDYSKQPLNLHGYVCALSAATWAVFSVLIVSVEMQIRWLSRLCTRFRLKWRMFASIVLVCFAVLDTVFAVRRALDVRAPCWNLWNATRRNFRRCMAVWTASAIVSAA